MTRIEVTSSLRVGIGHDTHRLQPGGPLRLGGIDIPHDREAVGHSDADVLLHAVTDAVLGGAALGDIGQMFPDTDDANCGRDSGEMLTAAHRRVRQGGFQIANVDCIVFAQRPQLAAYNAEICQRIALLLDLDVNLVSVKAKTGEGVGPIGNEEAIAAQCVALLEEMKD